jgi:uncharacterized protein YqgV (UPF0045/DUF77 family)|tara:strand:- start:407 stop:601 length:195 start_codon:yes stop_codon:yes gene_type:complete
MDKRTVSSAHERIDGLEKEVIAMQTLMKIQFKDLYIRIKRLESIMIAAAASIIGLLVAVLIKMG